MAVSVDELKKLIPEERIKRLKELEVERKKEIEEAEELIKETTREIAEAEERKKIPIPQARATDLSALATVEEKQVVATHHLLGIEATGAASEHQTTPAAPTTLSQQQRSLEHIAEEEGVRAQQQAQQQPQQFQKPVYGKAIEVTARQTKAQGQELYHSQSLQMATAATTAPTSSGSGPSISDKVMEFYESKAVTGAQNPGPQDKYFGKGQEVTGGYEIRKREEEERRAATYQRRTGPA